MNAYELLDDTVICSDCREPLDSPSERAVRMCNQCLADQNSGE